MHDDRSLQVITEYDTYTPFFSLRPSQCHKQDDHWTFFAEPPDGHYCPLLRSR